ncbi:ANR family transcriptional regulator [Escherichia coli]|uniref:ANR family transcriptional regulator n=1 Tax=Escherichia coli TaxID=562 RepID=UPI00209113D9|nr:ANR family transcriptional regulator [Escherichia coli]MCO4980722.1 ANR family transcriptional regulator [Escherichia coli]
MNKTKGCLIANFATVPRAGSRAVILEVSGRWMEAAEAWRRAAGVAPRTDWQQFARKRAEHCHRRSRGRV